MRVFVDLDGVLADFNRHYNDATGMPCDTSLDNVDWDKVRDRDFYLTIQPMWDIRVLWDYLWEYHPIILTGCPKEVPEAEVHKRLWVAKHLGPLVPVICCKSINKSHYCQPGDILIDDWEKYRDLWIKKGGIWITHTSAATTVLALQSIGL